MQGFIGKQKDKEMDLAEHGVRKYDDGLGRFSCPDKLWEKYYSWTPYQYSMNNPVNMMDGNGLLPGDAFSSAEVAAHDFGKNYYHKSNNLKVEYGATIYSFKDGGKTKYSYTIPEKGVKGMISLDRNIPEGTKVDSDIHTHNYTNHFSKADVQGEKYDQYIVTPDGAIVKHNAEDGKQEKVHEDVKKAEKEKKREIPEVDNHNEIEEKKAMEK